MDHDFDGYVPDRTHFCSGSIIDQNWIISAAHCFVDDDDANEVKIMSAKDRIIGFSNEIVIHPDFIPDPKFNYYNGQNDLALVKTEKPIQMNAFTQPIGLARLGAFGSTAIITAYENYKYTTSEFPLEDVVVVNQCTCAPNDSFILCAQSEIYVESSVSGAALKTDDGLVGIVSANEMLSTGEKYFIVDISFHLDWIQEVTKKTF
ncbi:hypothetical protein PYW08_008742 [Mythimna loreyi]|uniref:Uncharacterized protein n=1 Tax=Mythimna loreyi TaxID=667449 RepID=A0ACC2QDA8_9NEOP|nr:hypothetical protein PYW08_008742 [Mythimna loreyi]